MKTKEDFFLGVIIFLLSFTVVYSQSKYTETMDPNGLTKNLKDDYNLTDDNGEEDQSSKVENAINAINAQGGGRLIMPKGVYNLSDIFLKSNVHILIEAGTVIKVTPGNNVLFVLDVKCGEKQDFIENVSIRGIGGSFIVDYHYRTYEEKCRAIIARMVKNFLISDMDVKDNYSTYCGIILTLTKETGDISDWEVSRPTNGTIKNCRHFKVNPGYGLVQLHGAHSVHFENLYALGGVTLRLEVGANLTHVGVKDITAKNIICKNGRVAVMLAPHSAKSGVVTVDGVTAIGCTFAVSAGDGSVKEGAPDQTPGHFDDKSSIKNIKAVFGTEAQLRGHIFLQIPTKDYFDQMKIWSDEKFFDGPSIGAVFNGAEDYNVTFENITMEGFEYNNDKPILSEITGKWAPLKKEWLSSHKGDDWRVFKGDAVVPYNIEDFKLNVLSKKEVKGKSNVTIYPNPVKDNIHIRIETENPINLSLFDVVGRKVLSKKAQGNSIDGELHIDIESISAGLYVLELTDDNLNTSLGRYKVLVID